jgi:hypothetical protein
MADLNIKSTFLLLSLLALGVPALGQDSQTVIPGAPGAAGGRSGGGLPKPTDGASFRSLVQAALNGCYVVNLDGTAQITASGPINLTLKDCGSNPTGVKGNGLTINSTINNGADVITITTSGPNRSLVFEGLHVYGGGFTGKVSGNCLNVFAPRGGQPIYKFTLRDLWVDSCGKNGLNLEGDVYEGTVWNLQSENHGGSGVRLAHGTDGAVLSNVFLYAPNVSRNQRYGIEAANGASSIQLQFPSMINNWLGGGYFPHGVRNVIGGNCENTGLICMDVPSSDFQTRIVGLETSTDCATKGPGGGSQPTKYLYRYGGDAAKMKQSDNVIVPYGTAANCTGVALRAP